MSTDTSVLPEAPPPVAVPVARDAIIFAPGLLHDEETQSIDTVGLRMIHALNLQSATGAAVFTLSEGKEEDFVGNKTRTVTISRKDRQQQPPKPIIDLYGFNYRGVLTGQYENKKPIVQSLIIGWLLLSNIDRLITAFRRRSKTLAQKLHTFYAGLIFFLLAVYMIMLLVTAVGTAAKLARAEQVVPASPTPEAPKPAATPARSPTAESVESGAPPAKWSAAWAWGGVRGGASWVWRKGIAWMQIAVIFFAAFGLFTKVNLKATLARVSTELTCAMRYLATGARGGALAGQFSSLLNYIEEKEAETGITYRHIHVIGFSFGTVVTLDALFPRGSLVPRTQRIHTLVTVGCPFDFIRTYWPRYFEGRKGWSGTPRKWINVYAPADVLGSDFMDDVADKQAPGGVRQVPRGVVLSGNVECRPSLDSPFGQETSLGEYSYMDWLTLVGFRVHNCYWERGQTWDVSCFNDIVTELYKNDYILS